MHVEPIAYLRECAGAPVQEPCVQLVFAGIYRNADALRGIESFSHLWLVWGAGEEPVDVGGVRAKAASSTADAAGMGDVAALAAGRADAGALPFHAPQRPGGLGLACARLEEVRATKEQGTVLVLSGTPLAPGTPVYDVKPYLPYADAHPLAEEARDDAR